MKIIISIFTIFALQACSSLPDQEPRPSHIEQVTLPDGRVVDNYVFGLILQAARLVGLSRNGKKNRKRIYVMLPLLVLKTI